MTLCFVIICSTAFAQDSTFNDTIIKIDGDQIVAKILTVSEKGITFSYPDETVVNSLSKNVIKEIALSGGRKIFFNTEPIPEINGKDDWEKVKLTYDASEVEGLIKKEDIVVFAIKKNSFQPDSYLESKVIKEAKIRAATIGAPILYAIVPVASQNALEFRFLGIAYGYK